MKLCLRQSFYAIAIVFLATTAADAQSLSDSIVNSNLVFEEVDGILAVEAEHFATQQKDDVRTWFHVQEGRVADVKPDPDGPHLIGASGASYLEALPDSRATRTDRIVKGQSYFPEPGQAGVLTYNVHINMPGRYYVWARHFSTGSEDNGLHVGLDHQWPESGQRWQTTKKNKWSWECRQRTEEVHVGVPLQLYLDIDSAGPHQIHFSMREDGFEFDKFVLAADREFEPSEEGPEPTVKSGDKPKSLSLSKNYQEEPPKPILSKVTDISKVGVKYRASQSQPEAIAMTRSITDSDLVFEEVDGMVAIEAEHFASQEKDDIRAWFRVQEDMVFGIKPDNDPQHLFGSSGGSYLEALPDSRWTHDERLIHGENFFDEPNKAGVLTYKVFIHQPGRYYVWVRHFSTGSEDNGLHVGIDGTWPESGQRWQTTIKGRWDWECRQRTEEVHTGVPMDSYLDIPTAGEHEIEVSMREDGLEFDKLLLASDINYRPQSTGPTSIAKSGQIPPPKTLSAKITSDSTTTGASTPTVALPNGTARLAATKFKIDESNFYVDKGVWLAINPDQHKTATASTSVPVGNAEHTIVFHAVGENDGKSHFSIEIADKEIGKFSCPMSTDTYEVGEKYTAVFKDVFVGEGDIVKVTSRVASADGFEFSRGRWLGMTFLPASATKEQIESARQSFGEPKPFDKPKQATANIKVGGELKQWHKVTIDLTGPQADELDTDVNPFLDYRFDVTFTHSSGQPTYTVPGYFAADGDAGNTSATAGNIWRAHLSPDKVGQWTYKTSFVAGPRVAVGDNSGLPVKPFDAAEGRFTVQKSDKTGRDFRSHGRLGYVGKHHLQFAGSKKYFLKAGPDAPETLLAFTEFDNTQTRKAEKGKLKTWQPHVRDWRAGDPSWKGGKGKGLIGAMNYLASKGINAFSFLTYNAGGDGDNIWPFVDRDDKFRYDTSKLDQWGVVFDHAQANGLFLHFKLQENENDDNRDGARKTPKLIGVAMDGGNTGPERKLYLRELIARYGYHLALNWNLGEESTLSTAQQRSMATFIHQTDPYDHLIVIHSFPPQQDSVYSPLLGEQSFVRGASLQNSWNAAHQLSLKWIERSAATGVPWIVPNDEQNPAGAGVPPDPGYQDGDGLSGKSFGNYDLHSIRKLTLWGNLMAGGAGVEYYFGYKLLENDLNCEDWRSRDRSWDYCRIAIEFFQNNDVPFWEMKNADALIGNPENQNTGFCLAKPNECYVVYLPETKPTKIDLSQASGTFEIDWYDPRSGGELKTGSVKGIQGGRSSDLGSPPSDADQDWAILIRRK